MLPCVTDIWQLWQGKYSGAKRMTGRQPIFNIPASVSIGLILFVIVHVVRWFLPDEEGLRLLLALAFIPARYANVQNELPGGELSDYTSFITYMFVHGDATHLIINGIWMLAFGSAVAKRIGDLRFILFSFLCGITGALVHLTLHFGEVVPVVGASAAISGQMAAAIRFMFGARQQIMPQNRDLETVPLAGVGETLKNPKFLLFLGVWTALNLLFGLGGLEIGNEGGGIAWEAHFGGFLCGLLAFSLFDPVGNSGSVTTSEP